MQGKITISNQFYEDEVREGFYVPAAVKQAWGAQLKILGYIAEVCQKHDIQYYAEWGTFLGAVRHGGYIPWDDDMDIGMRRSDYEKFLKHQDELPEGFCIYNLRSKADHGQFLSNVVNKSRICFEPDHLREYHGFPYIACVDIFIIDDLSNDPAENEEMFRKARLVLGLSDALREGSFEPKYLEEALRKIERECIISIPRGLDNDILINQLDVLAEKIFATFSKKNADFAKGGGKSSAGETCKNVVQMMPWGLKGIKIQRKSVYDSFVELPFEEIKIPVPAMYLEALTARYGDFMTLYKNAGAHDYPYFLGQREGLKKLLDFELPEYKFNPAELRECAQSEGQKACNICEESCSPNTETGLDNAEGSIKSNEGGKTNDSKLENSEIYSSKTDSYKAIALECIEQLRGLWKEYLKTADFNLLGDIQNLAIELGTYMENVKGEGYDLVHILEEMCERVYELSKERGAEEVEDMTLDDCLERLENGVKKRREAVFLPFKAGYFENFRGEYQRLIQDPDMDVYVVPIPYFYKDYDGRLMDMQYDLDFYDQELSPIHCDNFDFEIHRPDIIYIQYPYDGMNEVTGIPPFLYASNLKNYTDQLIYIPWFTTEDFTRESARNFKNMRYYVTMPGVVNSDRVLVQSETIRETYIEALTDWAGADTRTIWEKKIEASQKKDESAKPQYPAEWLPFLKKADGYNKKILLYHVETGLLITDEGILEKISKTLDIFEENKENVMVIWKEHSQTTAQLPMINPDMYNKYKELVSKFQKMNFGLYLTDINDNEYELMDAYYGDAGAVAHRFRNMKKPVMIQNVEII